MDHASFCKHWRDVHAPLMAAAPGVKYVQNYVVAVIEPLHVTSSPPDVDGFAWIDVTPQPAAQPSTPQGGGNAAALDLPNFVGASSRMICRAQVILPISSAKAIAKVMVVIGHQGQQRSQTGRCDPLDDQVAAVAAIPGLVGCRQNTVTGHMPLTDRRIADAGLNALVVMELWFENAEAARAAMTSSDWRKIQSIATEFGCAPTNYLVEEVVVA